MKILKILILLARRTFYRWALREIDPMHPDVFKVVMRELTLTEKLRSIL